MNNRDYPVELFKIETTDGSEWMARFPDVKGCVGGGTTQVEALNEALENLDFHLKCLKDANLPIPEPSKIQTTYKGNISVRMSSGLHEQVSYYAKKENISINQFIIEAISERIGKVKTENSISKLLNKLNYLLDNLFVKKNKNEILYSNIFETNNSDYHRSSIC